MGCMAIKESGPIKQLDAPILKQENNNKIKCIQKEDCLLVCNTQNCSNIPFMCNNQNCACYQIHQNCKTSTQWKKIKDKLDAKLKGQFIQVQKSFNEVELLYNNVLNRIQTLATELKSSHDLLGLSPIEKQLFVKLKQNQFNQLRGSTINLVGVQLENKSFKYLNIQKQKEQIVTTSQKLILMLNNLVKKIGSSFQQVDKSQVELDLRQIPDETIVENTTTKGNIQNNLILKRFEIDLKDMKKKINQQKMKNFKPDFFSSKEQLQLMMCQTKKKFIECKKDSLRQFQIFEQKIIKSKTEENWQELQTNKFILRINTLSKQGKNILQQFFDNVTKKIFDEIVQFRIYNLKKLDFFNKNIKQINLLYKASQNNFQVSKFWEKCDGKNQTIIIVKTEFGKTIGAYTPITWNRSLNGFQLDKKKQSFIFSITDNEKLNLINEKSAIYINYAKYGPIFGQNYDIFITDKANISASSVNPGDTYKNDKYAEPGKQSKKRFSGHDNQFLISEWQVFQLKFE